MIMATLAYNIEAIGKELNKELQYNPPSPSNHIQENQILVYESEVMINQSNVHWASVTPTGSMKNTINEHSNLLEITPTNEEQIGIGDIVSYKTEDGIIIHRIIKKEKDSKGTYFIVRGDTNWIADSIILRFEDIKGLVIGVIY